MAGSLGSLVSRVSRFSSWRRTLWLKRRVNASNVFLLETDDPKRLEELLAGNPPLASELTAKEDPRRPPVIVYDLQRSRPRVVYRGNNEVYLDEKPEQLPDLLRLAEKTPVTIVMHWVATKRHADAISDILLAASHNPHYYRPAHTATHGGMLSSTIIVLTFSLELFPLGLRKFLAEIPIPPSTEEERRGLIHGLAEDLKSLKGIDAEITPDAVNAAAGLTLHEVETAVLEAAVARQRVDAEAFRAFKVELLHRWGLEYIAPTRGFESVGGYDYLKRFLLDEVAVFYREPRLTEDYGLTPPRGLLLFGPPGTGKTWITKALAKEMGLPMVKLSAADILRGIVGESEQRARRIARIVESMAPIVVFIDEADQLFRSRATTLATDSGVSQRVQNILLDWLGDEDRRSFIVMATNFPEQLDWAAVRAGRVDYAVPVLLPDARARAEILRYHTETTEPRPKVGVNVDYNEVARLTRGWTPAELAQLARAAKLEAARQRARAILTDHFVEAMDRGFRINAEERILQVRRMVTDLRGQNAVVRQDILEEALRALSE